MSNTITRSSSVTIENNIEAPIESPRESNTPLFQRIKGKLIFGLQSAVGLGGLCSGSILMSIGTRVCAAAGFVTSFLSFLYCGYLVVSYQAKKNATMGSQLKHHQQLVCEQRRLLEKQGQAIEKQEAVTNSLKLELAEVKITSAEMKEISGTLENISEALCKGLQELGVLLGSLQGFILTRPKETPPLVQYVRPVSPSTHSLDDVPSLHEDDSIFTKEDAVVTCAPPLRGNLMTEEEKRRLTGQAEDEVSIMRLIEDHKNAEPNEMTNLPHPKDMIKSYLKDAIARAKAQAHRN